MSPLVAIFNIAVVLLSLRMVYVLHDDPAFVLLCGIIGYFSFSALMNAPDRDSKIDPRWKDGFRR